MPKPKPFPTDRAHDSQRGQVLVIAALSLVVLLLFVALATDVGYWYGERRHMQNAADAGALAGAWQLCFGSRDAAVSSAIDYAVRNGADEDLVIVDIVDSDGTPDPVEGNVVVVTAGKNARTFFASLVSMHGVRVNAVAASACGKALSGCGALPIAFDSLTYQNEDLLPCSDYDWDNHRFTNYVAGSTFVLWADDNSSTRVEAMCDQCMCEMLNDYVEPYLSPGTNVRGRVWDDDKGEYVFEWRSWAEWEALPGQPQLIIGGEPMAPGNRGWLRLGLQKPYDQPYGTGDDPDCASLQNCGAAVKCWIKYGFTGSLAEDNCVKGKSGVDAVVLSLAKVNVGEVRPFVLYDRNGCDPDDPITANCSEGGGTIDKLFKIDGFGCGLILHVFDKQNHNDITLPNSPGYPCGGVGESACADCPEKQLGILVTKLCEDCPNTTCVGTDGSPQGSGEVGAASLIPVPAGYVPPMLP